MKNYIAIAAVFAALCTPAVSFAQYNPASYYVPSVNSTTYTANFGVTRQTTQNFNTLLVQRNTSFVQTYTPNYVPTPTYQNQNTYQNQHPTQYQNQQNRQYQNQYSYQNTYQNQNQYQNSQNLPNQYHYQNQQSQYQNINFGCNVTPVQNNQNVNTNNTFYNAPNRVTANNYLFGTTRSW